MHGAASTLEIEDAIAAAHVAECRARYEQLLFIRNFDRLEGWRVDGARSMTDWVAYRFGYGEESARLRVMVARALEFLPAIADAFWEGLLSWDKVRWLCEFCTPDEDARWADVAIGMNVAQIRKMAMHRKRIARQAADARHKRRYLKIVSDPDEGMVHIWGCLPDAQGAVVKKTIERIATQAPRDPQTGKQRPFAERCADALTELASIHAGQDADPDRANVVVHADATVFTSAARVADLEGGITIAADTLRRLTCDGRVQTIVHGADGGVVAMSDMTRTVPAYLYRQVRARDGGCKWPGCTNTVWIHVHHVTHFADHGPTRLSNLLALCPYHHQLVHEGGWNVRWEPDDDPEFIRPDGTILGRPRVAHTAPQLARAP